MNEETNENYKTYSVYGMVVESELVLPQLQPIAQEALSGEAIQPVEIRWGHVPDRLSEDAPSAHFIRVGDTCLLRVPDAGNYLITSERVTIQKHDHASVDDVEAYLLGTVLATVAHLRGLVPLHVSAVLSPMGAIAFTGESGAGKSTMAAHIHHRTGWPLISDDVSAVYETKDGMELESGVLTVKLWKDALASLDRSSDGLKRDAERMDKFHAIDGQKFVVGRYPLKKLFLLEWGEEDRIEPVTGRDAFKVALASIYRPELVDLCQNRDHVSHRALGIARSVEVQKIVRRKGIAVEEGIFTSIESTNLFSEKQVGDIRAD